MRSAVVTLAHTPVCASVDATAAVCDPEPCDVTIAIDGPPTASTTAAATAYNQRLRPARCRVATSLRSLSIRRGPGAAKGCTERGVACRYSISCRVAGLNSLTCAAHWGHSMR